MVNKKYITIVDYDGARHDVPVPVFVTTRKTRVYVGMVKRGEGKIDFSNLEELESVPPLDEGVEVQMLACPNNWPYVPIREDSRNLYGVWVSRGHIKPLRR